MQQPKFQAAARQPSLYRLFVFALLLKYIGQLLQLHQAHNRLNFGHAKIQAGKRTRVPAARYGRIIFVAVVVQGARAFIERAIVGNNGAAFACRHVFRKIKTVNSGGAQRAQSSALVAAAKCLRGIFQHRQLVRGCDR